MTFDAVLTNARQWHIEAGHVLETLRLLPDDCVQCVVTSPPYWGLRDYGLEPQVWGGDAECEHDFEPIFAPGGSGDSNSFRRDKQAGRKRGGLQPGFCRHCSAWLGSFGLEPTIELYVEHAVEIFREVRRVLRPDGVCFLNLGDSYNGVGGQGKQDGGPIGPTARRGGVSRKNAAGLKPKDLCGVPWCVALALRNDGWWLRSDIIWAKPNPMPSSVTDRPTTSHEYVFLLTKRARYFWDQEAVREPPSGVSGGLVFGGRNKGVANRANGIRIVGREFSEEDRERYMTGGANCRSVWTIPTQSYSDAHFATFPEKLVERCLKAGTKDDCLVLDPFAGSGTTGRVCRQMGLRFVGCELNPEYIELARQRIDAPFTKSPLPKVTPAPGQLDFAFGD